MLLKLCLTLGLTLFSFSSQAQEAQSTQNTQQTPTYERVENDYYNCLASTKGYSDDEKAICMEGEIKRLDREINKLYQKTFLQEARIQKWNNGNGMFRGNIKDMQDEFNGYRSRFCSFYAVTMEIYSGSQAYLRNECLMKVTEEYYNRLLQMARDYDADLD